MDFLHDSQLGKASTYSERRDPGLLFPIPRDEGRAALGNDAARHFVGCDIWHAWELSWLNERGRPQVAVARFTIDCHSPNLIESKSFKLYLNSLAQTRFSTRSELAQVLREDLGSVAEATFEVEILDPDAKTLVPQPLPGESLDDIDLVLESGDYGPPQADWLQADTGQTGSEVLTTRLFRSNCPVTGQPDWASVQIAFEGPRVDRAGLLRYLVSFRNHSGFHEQCVERIFTDLHLMCSPRHLDVRACFTRRGGLDINPWRSTRHPRPATAVRDPRQ